MKTQWWPLGLVAVLAMTFLLVGSFLTAQAQAADDEEESAAAPPPAAVVPVAVAPVAVVPDTLPEVQAQIAKVRTQIEELDAEASKLISMAEQEKRQKIRRQIKSLKLQLRILKRREGQLTEGVAQADVQAIRERYRARLREIDQRKSAARRRAISQFEQILAQSPESGLAPDILFRLANLYFEEAHSSYLDAWDRYEYEAEQLVSQGATDVVPEEPRHDYSRSVELLDSILRHHAGYARRDEVMYLMAYCLQEQSDDDRALLVYDRMIKETPDSAKAPEAYVRMAEIYFDRDQYERAIERYQQLLRFRESKFYDKALYKLGWSYYKLDDYENAVKYFTEVLNFYKHRSVTRRRGKSDDLLQESVDYIAISFTEGEGLDGGKAAVSFMKSLGDEEIGRQILLKVGEVYDERTDYEPARGAYGAYLQNFPLALDVPEVLSKLAQTYEKEQRFDDAMEVYDRIAKTLGPGSEWSQVNGARKRESERAAKLVQTSIMARATFHHEKAQNTTGAESQAHYLKAIESYELYIANYPDAKGAYETAFNLGESYMEVERYNAAAAQYEFVIERKQDKELWTTALFNNTKAFELQLEKEGGLPNKDALVEPEKATVGDSEKPKGVSIAPTKMGATAQNWITALETHVVNLPDSDKSPAMLYKVGEIYYLHGDFPMSDRYFEQVLQKYPQHEVAQLASYYFIESSKQAGDYVKLQDKLKVVPDASGITQEQKHIIAAGAQFKIAEQKMKEATAATPADRAKVLEAITEYEKGIQENPGAESAGIALHNVAVAHEQYLTDLLSANEAYLRLAANYPKNPHAKDGLLSAAFNYQIMVEFDAAIEAYGKFAQTWPDDRKNAGDALFNAAALEEESGRYMAAISSYQTYLSSYATETDAGEVSFTIARLYEKMGDSMSAEQAYEEQGQRDIDAARLTEAYFRWGKLLESRGDVGSAEKRFLQSVAVFIKAREAGGDDAVDSAFAAESQFRVAQMHYDEYKNIVFTGNIRRDTELLKAKAEAFKVLKVNYEEVVTYGNYKWATAALHMLGMINQDFSDALLNAPAPEDLPPEQQDEYIFKLEEIAFPIKNRALEAFKQNVNKGINERQVNEWIVKSYEELKVLEPQTAEPKFEMVIDVDSPAFTLAPVDLKLPTVPTAAPAADQPGGSK